MEAATEEKSEYRDGKIVPMTGGSTDHNDIARNLYAHLKFALRQKPYMIFIGDVRLWISACRLFTYLDAMLITEEPAFYEGRIW